MTRRPPYRDGRLHVMAERCSDCVFRSGNLMSLQPGRLRSLVEDNLAADAALTCHQTTYGQDERGEAICAGFAAAFGHEVTGLRAANIMGLIERQDPVDTGGPVGGRDDAGAGAFPL